MTIITSDYLNKHPDHIFVFGDNTTRTGYGGAAVLRNHENAYGFITKVFSTNGKFSFYTTRTYERVLAREIKKLIFEIISNPNQTYLISKLGAGLANKYDIWDIIKPELLKLKKYPNVKLLWCERCGNDKHETYTITLPDGNFQYCQECINKYLKNLSNSFEVTK